MAYEPKDVLKQRGRMLFLDRIKHWTDDEAQCTVIVGKNRSFVDAYKRVPAWLGLEYMCQAIAALEGIKRLQQGQMILISFVLGSRLVKSDTSFFCVGDHLLVEVENEMKIGGAFGVYACRIKLNDTLLMHAHIKGIMSEDPYNIIYRG